jgi:hypothetical protein
VEHIPPPPSQEEPKRKLVAILEVISNMDVNLTGQVAANLIQNPIMTVSAGVIGGFVTGMITLAGIRMTQKHDEGRRIREEKQRWLESRKIAYYKFIEAFSTPVVGDDIFDYLHAALEAAGYGNVILSDSFEPKVSLIVPSRIESLVVCRIFCKLDGPVIPHISIRIHR